MAQIIRVCHQIAPYNFILKLLGQHRNPPPPKKKPCFTNTRKSTTG